MCDYLETVLLEMADPVNTTAAAGRFIDVNLRFLFGTRAAGRHQTDH
jgi:hypothetical protein